MQICENYEAFKEAIRKELGPSLCLDLEADSQRLFERYGDFWVAVRDSGGGCSVIPVSLLPLIAKIEIGKGTVGMHIGKIFIPICLFSETAIESNIDTYVSTALRAFYELSPQSFRLQRLTDIIQQVNGAV